jgi:UDP-2-acetamido-3-amino-2,3-dideoxy-glucuronate N-acetyltransferase
MVSKNVHVTADVSLSAHVSSTANVWHYAQVREDAVIGESCVIGRGAYIGKGVSIGDNCKVQNYALVYEPAVIEAGVFIGPAAVLTNDQFPRAINADGSPKASSDWVSVGVTARTGASIGANATCIAPVTIGRWALVGSGAVVTKDVPDFALVVGNPARRIAWVGKAGIPLALKDPRDATLYVCPHTNEEYREVSANELIEVVEV